MNEIIPAVNAENFADVQEKIRRVQNLARWVHIDVADGTFTKNVLWRNPEDLKSEIENSGSKINIEIHLMVENPEAVIAQWIAAGARRIIIHVETIKNFELIKSICDKARVFLVLSVAPQTNVHELDKYFAQNIVAYQVLAVNPGLPGQKLIESSYEKLRYIHSRCPHCDIEIDGGINADTIQKCYNAGANLFVAASAVFGAPNIEDAIIKLQNLVNQVGTDAPSMANWNTSN